MITPPDVEAAAERIRGAVRRTPVMAASQLQAPLPGEARVTLKLESLQVTGSFKARGAMNRLLARPPENPAAGLVTASGGNHGLAVARTAAVAGVPGAIYLPRTASPAKAAKIRRWGAHVTTVGDVFDEADEAARAHAARTGAAYIHPFADPLVVAGQGTLGLEILDDLPDLDLVVVAIGGGGLVAGLAVAMQARRPGLRIVGVEPEGSPTIKACLDAGHVISLPAVTTRVATMACRRTDEAVFDLLRERLETVVLVSDDEMADAARALWFEAGVAADLSGAAALAALRTGRVDLAGARHVCAIVCGAGEDAFAPPAA